MCGIIGYTGKKQVKDIILDGLAMLEYRGYDSAGIAMSDRKTGKTDIRKCAGRVADLRKLCGDTEFDSTCGIGHTRWATHGGVNDANAHPHKVGGVSLVHNGIVENYRDIISDYHFENVLDSETDSEVAAALINYFYEKYNDPKKAICESVKRLHGTFAFVIMFEEVPGVIFSVRNVSPIVATLCDEGAMLASDVTALCSFTRRYFVLPEYTIAELHKDALYLWTLDGKAVLPEYMIMDWEKNCAEKDGYPFYMEKEIMEQPRAINDTILPRMKGGIPNFEEDRIPDSLFTDCDRICVVACGTAMHAGLVFQALVKSVLHMHIDVEMASEFIYCDPVIDSKTLVIAVSQSGETIDTLGAVKYAMKKGARTLGIINVKGSSIARECDYVLYTNAGPEIAVASTKAYTTQLSLFFMIVCKMASLKGIWSNAKVHEFTKEMCSVPDAMQKMLDNRREIHVVARTVLDAKDLFMIGRGLDYSILQEGSLKLKEVSYIHSEAYASGELKHGPIALITDSTPVVAVVTQKKLIQKELSNIREVRSRGASIVLFVKNEYSDSLEQEFQICRLPDLPDEMMVFPASVALQLLAYYVSADKGFDVDKPRNLAKVVTVE